ncbi:MAG: ABC transporter ATP-binding protein [Sphaerochaetaceae bacterium]|nr:ABC transporter ATP-binding protein [Sphaerochaetaceae bacterium]
MFFRRLSKSYYSKEAGTTVPVFVDFSLDIPSGTIQVLTGPSGCGKTTLLHLAAGLTPLDGGSILREPCEVGPVSYLFQEPRLLPWRNVFTNVELPLRASIPVKEEREAKVLRFLSLVGLSGYEAYLPSELSGGMRQRVAIARAFAYPSTLILMDEPFQSLDVKLRYELLQAFLHLWQDERRTTLYVTHDVAEAVLAADSVCRLDGPPAEIADLFSIDVPRSRRKPGLPELMSYEGRLYGGLTG